MSDPRDGRGGGVGICPPPPAARPVGFNYFSGTEKIFQRQNHLVMLNTKYQNLSILKYRLVYRVSYEGLSKIKYFFLNKSLDSPQQIFPDPPLRYFI